MSCTVEEYEVRGRRCCAVCCLVLYAALCLCYAAPWRLPAQVVSALPCRVEYTPPSPMSWPELSILHAVLCHATQHLGDVPHKLSQHCHAVFEYTPPPPMSCPDTFCAACCAVLCCIVLRGTWGTSRTGCLSTATPCMSTRPLPTCPGPNFQCASPVLRCMLCLCCAAPWRLQPQVVSALPCRV
jgi:hypothetical protein